MDERRLTTQESDDSDISSIIISACRTAELTSNGSKRCRIPPTKLHNRTLVRYRREATNDIGPIYHVGPSSKPP